MALSGPLPAPPPASRLLRLPRPSPRGCLLLVLVLVLLSLVVLLVCSFSSYAAGGWPLATCYHTPHCLPALPTLPLPSFCWCASPYHLYALQTYHAPLLFHFFYLFLPFPSFANVSGQQTADYPTLLLRGSRRVDAALYWMAAGQKTALLSGELSCCGRVIPRLFVCNVAWTAFERLASLVWTLQRRGCWLLLQRGSLDMVSHQRAAVLCLPGARCTGGLWTQPSTLLSSIAFASFTYSLRTSVLFLFDSSCVHTEPAFSIVFSLFRMFLYIHGACTFDCCYSILLPGCNNVPCCVSVALPFIQTRVCDAAVSPTCHMPTGYPHRAYAYLRRPALPVPSVYLLLVACTYLHCHGVLFSLPFHLVSHTMLQP